MYFYTYPPFTYNLYCFSPICLVKWVRVYIVFTYRIWHYSLKFKSKRNTHSEMTKTYLKKSIENATN